MSPEVVELYKWTWQYVLGDFWHFLGFVFILAVFRPFQLFSYSKS